MNNLNGSQSAYPTQDIEEQYTRDKDGNDDYRQAIIAHGGLTKREMFAMAAMQGLCVPSTPGNHNMNDSYESAQKAQMAVRLADALLTELELTSGGADE